MWSENSKNGSFIKLVDQLLDFFTNNKNVTKSHILVTKASNRIDTNT